MATVANDGAEVCAALAVPRHCAPFTQVPDTYTAQAMIMTDRDSNQIHRLHPAMNQAHLNHVEASRGVAMGIIAPDGRDAMLQHAAELQAAGIPFVLTQARACPCSRRGTRRVCRAGQLGCRVDYEAKMLCERTGWSLADISRKVRGLVVTLGAEGCDVWEAGVARRGCPLGPGPGGGSHRAAVMPGVALCCWGCRAGRWCAARNWATAWATRRSRSVGRKTTCWTLCQTWIDAASARSAVKKPGTSAGLF